MSLQDDLMRNRRVFELLTGNTEQEPDAPRQQASSGFAVSDGSAMEPRAQAGLGPPGEAGAAFQAARARGFSLDHGAVDLPFGFADLPGASAVAYPGLEPETVHTAASRLYPLEPLYRQMELDARMTSQLSREEDYFVF